MGRYRWRKFNDSKGTNVGSVVKSLLSFEEPILLIAGGRDKEEIMAPLKRSWPSEKVKGMALIGEARERMFGALGDLNETVKVGSLEEAVHSGPKPGRGMWSLLPAGLLGAYDMFQKLPGAWPMT